MLYPCRLIINCFSLDSEYATPVYFSLEKKYIFHEITNVPSQLSIVLPDLIATLSFISSYLWWAIYKTSNIGTGNGMRGMRGTRGMFTRIPGNLLRIPRNVIVLTFRGMFQKISGECLRRFRGMFEEIPGNVEEDPWECSRRFRGMFERILGNVQEGSGECSRRFRGI